MRMREKTRKEREEWRKREKHNRELSLRRMMIALISSPNVKRGHGEDGDWNITPYFKDRATDEVEKRKEDTIDDAGCEQTCG